ncbi:FMN reductase [Microvirga mediterraneensis]|uniref:FMN reductase n=1 Tax=Microvirga mediterraneensis TaxID=2754695 RepID=A0A838BQZ1_9HYPH|nr:FMN reductase [Microvirga mediterraneensis]MBA1157947.1 FMN reductase [Microvirga mediterraneensis]
MARPRIVGIAGSSRRPSKTRSLVEAIGAEVGRSRPLDFIVHDLAGIGAGLGGASSRAHLSPEAARILRDIETADALIVGTPVFKGSYAGLFKHLFDLVEPDALKDVPVLLTATGGGLRHAFVVEHYLRPLFGFFEALTIPTAVYASESNFIDGTLVDAAVRERASKAAAQLSDVLGQRIEQARDHEPARFAAVR